MASKMMIRRTPFGITTNQVILSILLLIFSSLQHVESFSIIDKRQKRTTTTTTTTIMMTKKPIEKVAIIGAGISGLALAHALSNKKDQTSSSIQISMFESRKEMDFQLGAGIQINGGLIALRQINPALEQAVRKAGMPVQNIQSNCNSWWKDQTVDRMWDLDIEQVLTKANATDLLLLSSQDETKNNDNNFVTDDKAKVAWYCITRGALLESLYNELPKSVAKNLSLDKTLTNIINSSTDTGAICEFHDGSTAGPFHLIIGCDGIQSKVKNYIENNRQVKLDKKSSSIYSGIRVRYAVKDTYMDENEKRNRNNQSTATLQQFFGNGAFALKGIYGAGSNRPRCKSVFLIYNDDNYIGPFKKKQQEIKGQQQESTTTTSTKTINYDEEANENIDWVPDSVKSTKSEMLQQISQYKLPYNELSPIIEAADRFFELGVYFHNPFSFSGWSKTFSKKSNNINNDSSGLAVLCGDSAHAMPPFLGQGANQALQDAVCLANKIHLYNKNITNSNDNILLEDSDDALLLSLPTLLKEYEATRWKPTASITIKSALLGYVETGGPNGIISKFRDSLFRTLYTFGIVEKVLVDAASPNLE